MANFDRDKGIAESITTLGNKYAINEAMGKLLARRRETESLGHTQEIAEVLAAEMVGKLNLRPIPIEGDGNE